MLNSKCSDAQLFNCRYICAKMLYFKALYRIRVHSTVVVCLPARYLVVVSPLFCSSLQSSSRLWVWQSSVRHVRPLFHDSYDVCDISDAFVTLGYVVRCDKALINVMWTFLLGFISKCALREPWADPARGRGGRCHIFIPQKVRFRFTFVGLFFP